MKVPLQCRKMCRNVNGGKCLYIRTWTGGFVYVFVCVQERTCTCLQTSVYVGVYMCGNVYMYVILCLCGREKGKTW